jgi:hypothetical protein
MCLGAFRTLFVSCSLKEREDCRSGAADIGRELQFLNLGIIYIACILQ